MKLAALSDLHNEFIHWLPLKSLKDADVIILAGDKGVYQSVLKKMCRAAQGTNIHLLHCGIVFLAKLSVLILIYLALNLRVHCSPRKVHDYRVIRFNPGGQY